MISTGDYIRNKYGIARVIKAETKNGIYIVQLDKDIAFIFDTKAKKEIKRTNILPITEDVNLSKLKISPNIIDLIEVGDYVNGHLVIDIAEQPKKAIYIEDAENKLAHFPYVNSEIKSILTKEQIELIEYKVGDK